MKQTKSPKAQRTETLISALNLLEDDMVEHTEARRRKELSHDIPAKTTAHSRRVIGQKCCAAAACLFMLCAMGAALYLFLPQDMPGNQRDTGNLPAYPQQTLPPEIAENTENSEPSPLPSTDATPEPQPFVAIASLFPDTTAEAADIAKPMALHAAAVPVGNYTGQYECETSAQSTLLSESIGNAVPDAEGWYQVSGHTDMQYLIFEKEGNYSLWKFHHFLCEEYPYSDVLRLVYDIDSADQITELESMPAQMDNTDMGKKIQEQIGTHTITDRDKIDAFYQIISSMSCCGSDRWDLIHYGDADADTGLSSHAAVRLGRYLSFVTDYGNTVDGLKYTAVSDMFYEFEGVAYDALTAEQAAEMRNILNMTE